MTDTPNDQEREEREDQEREEREDREAVEAKAAGPEAELAYWKARYEVSQKRLEAGRRAALSSHKRLEAVRALVFSGKVKLYERTAEMITLLGCEHVLTVLADPAEDALGDLEISAEDHRQMMEQNRDIVTAIGQGMSLREYLEFDSARSWLDREQSEDDNTDNNTGAMPE